MQFVIHNNKVKGDAEVGWGCWRGLEEGAHSLLFVQSLAKRPGPHLTLQTLLLPLRPLQSEPLGGLVCLEAGVLQQWLRVSVDIWAVQATAVLSTRRFRWMTVVLEGMEVLPLSADQWSQWNRIRKHL